MGTVKRLSVMWWRRWEFVSACFSPPKLTAGESPRGGAGGEASFRRSLERLRTERIDLLQVHNLDGVDELMPALQKWKQAGKIRYIGITTSRVAQHARMAEYMRKYPIDFVQVDYSLANRDAAANILPLALERKMAVLANIPFAFGMLFSQVQSRALPDWASGIEVTTWSQFLAQVRDFTSGGDLHNTGLDPGRPPRGQSASRLRAPSGRGDAAQDGAILGRGLGCNAIVGEPDDHTFRRARSLGGPEL